MFVLCTDILKVIILEEPYDPRAAPKEKRLQHERRPDAQDALDVLKKAINILGK